MKRQNKLLLAFLACATATSAAVISCSSSSKEDGAGDGDGSGGEGDGSGGSAGDGSGGNAGSGAGPGAGGAGGNAPPKAGNGGSLSTTNTAECVPPKLKLTSVATASDSTMAIAQAEGDDRIFVVERKGIVRILRNGKLESTPFADLRSSVLVMPEDASGERGLLNFVLHPEFAANGRFFVFYTRLASDPYSTGGKGDVVIAEGKRSAMADKAEKELKALSTVPHPEDGHVGGFLGFGPDGKLYAGIGDGGSKEGFWDGYRVGQDEKRKLSKILRIDVDKPDEKPAGNMKHPEADKHSWAMGARNPFRGSFDRATGDLYFGDVGEASYEEINFVPRGYVPPENEELDFGWGFNDKLTEGVHWKQSGMEGLHPMPSFTAVAWSPRDYLPIFEYPHDGIGWAATPASYKQMGYQCGGQGANCQAAVVGGFVYRGKKMPKLYGRYIFGDHVRNKINSFIVKDSKATCEADLTADLANATTRVQGLTGFGQDAEGELYVLDLMGHIYRIDAE